MFAQGPTASMELQVATLQQILQGSSFLDLFYSQRLQDNCYNNNNNNNNNNTNNNNNDDDDNVYNQFIIFQTSRPEHLSGQWVVEKELKSGSGWCMKSKRKLSAGALEERRAPTFRANVREKMRNESKSRGVPPPPRKIDSVLPRDEMSSRFVKLNLVTDGRRSTKQIDHLRFDRS